jgi:alpha-methylacyl-CoA racemase
MTIIEFGAIGPAPFCGMMFADMGANVILLERKSQKGIDREGSSFDKNSSRSILRRGKRSVAVDLKSPEDVQRILAMIENADAIIEGFRPGVMERLGLGPDVMLERNPRLVYGRMTGWGQSGPLAQTAGHDINYMAITGALNMIGRSEGGPVAPPAMVGNLGGGGMLLAFGILCAVYEARSSGRGQVVDAAITDGVALLTTIVCELRANGSWRNNERQANIIDGGSHFYDTYECADGRWISIGSIEPQFYELLLEKLSIEDPDFKLRHDPAAWPTLKGKIAAVFRSQTSAHWCTLMEGTDVCFAPVLTLDEALAHPHNVARRTFFMRDSVLQPAPAPRFSRTQAGPPARAPSIGENDDLLLS